MNKIAVLGSGGVAQTLAKGLKTHGYDVRIGSRSPDKLAAFAKESGIAAGTFAEVAGWADGLVLAVLGQAAIEAMELAGAKNIDGKTVLDATNPLTSEAPKDGVLGFFTGPNESLMERLQSKFPTARFVKAFNSVGAPFMVNPKFPGGKPTMFYCGNDAAAKKDVLRIIEQFGWEGADMGVATSARALEPLCQLWCLPGFRDNEWAHAFKLMKM